MSSHGTARGGLGSHPLLVAAALYVVIAIPAYFLLEGPVGTAGTVDPSVVVGGLLLGSIMIVPMLKAALESRDLVGTAV